MSAETGGCHAEDGGDDNCAESAIRGDVFPRSRHRIWRRRSRRSWESPIGRRE